MKYFMLDIETTGDDPASDDIIQIGLLELNRDNNGYYVPGKEFLRTLHTSKKPKLELVRKMHKDLLPICLRTPTKPVGHIRWEIIEWFKSCGETGPVFLMGLNLMSLDIKFLVEKGYLVPPISNENNVLVGDFHYRIYELRGSYNVASDVLGLEPNELFPAASLACPVTYTTPGKPHEALFDCYRQINILNGVIRLLRQENRSVAV